MDQKPQPAIGLRTRCSFVMEREGVRLAGRLLLPSGAPPFACVIFVHGLGSGKDSPRNTVIAEHLVDAGFAALLFDLSGHGDSEEDPRGSDERAYIDDLAAAFAWASSHAEIDASRLGLAGSSLGAVIAIEAARLGRVVPAAMVLRAPPIDEDGLSGIGVPSLVIVGSNDPLLYQLERARRGGNVALEVIPGASHLFEEPGTLDRALASTVGWFKAHLA